MTTGSIIICVLFSAVSLFFLLRSCKKCEKPLRALTGSALGGIVSLTAMKLIGNFIDVNVNLNIFSLVFSSVLGLPGAILLAVF